MKDQFETWDRNTPERFIFDMLVRRSETAVVDYWENILEIIAANIDHNKDFELKMDMLALTDHLLSQTNLHSTIEFYSELILKLIIIPSTEWRVGIPNVKIRKAAIICFMKLIEVKLIEPSKVQEVFKDIISKLSSCLDDEFYNDLRFASVVLLNKLIVYLDGELDYENFNELYPQMLKRLDDA